VDSISNHTPTRTRPNFGQRAAKLSSLAAISNTVLVGMSIPILIIQVLLHAPVSFIPLGCSLGLSIIGLLSGVVSIAAMQRYGRNGILLRATTGLALNLAMSGVSYVLLRYVLIFSALGGRV
jgi:hypothetical protein